VTDVSLFEGPDGPGGAPTWTVPELAVHLGRVMAGAFPDDLWVEGQIRDLSRAKNGHVYFTLVEPTEAGRQPRAQLAVTLLAPERQHVNDQLMRAGGSVRMTDGVEVRIRGRVRWYAPRGVVQLRMDAIDPAFTLGRLQADRERLLAALTTEGIIGRNARVPFPLVPLRIGLVTSIGSAAHADVMAELTASGFGFDVVEVDARTQGDDCAPSVVRALTRLTELRVDVVLLVRGGGARTDLAGFDAELMARAIAAMPVPVLTGIGHEVDRSIADEVAHRAHKTPTAAAADVVRAVRAYLDRVDRLAVAISRAASGVANAADARLDRRAERLRRVASSTLDRRLTHLDRAGTRLGRAADRCLVVAERDLDRRDTVVRAHDPQLALDRGWSITTTADGRLVRSPSDVAPGDALITRVAGGRITSTVEDPP
jgi:exodeoxyribonuclease VII large subunit